MKHPRFPTVAPRYLLCAGLLWAVVAPSAGGATNVFSTRFEASEGYDGAWTLAGQQGWLGDGTGGNGIITNAIAGEGQQAYVGYFAPESTNENELIVWLPINFNPLASGLPIVRFSVLLSITDSAAGDWDRFGWDFYNSQSNWMFSIEFDNYYRDVAYVLDGTNDWVYTPVTFTNDHPYRLAVTLDFAANRWSATLDSQLIASNQPITTVGAELTLGDFDAYWWLSDPTNPGDNYMLFDNFQITAEALAPPQPRLELVGRTGNGQTLLRLAGHSGTRFAVDSTTNFATWMPLKTNVTTDGYFDLIDTPAAPASQRFYRGRWVP